MPGDAGDRLSDADYSARTYYQGAIAASYLKSRTGTVPAKEKWYAEIAAVREFLVKIPSARLILDVPCGEGRLAEVFRALDREWLGLDISLDMLRQIERPSLGLVKADAVALPLPSATVDCAVCLRFLNLIPRQVVWQFMRELHRTVRTSVIIQVRVRRGRVVDPLMRSVRRIGAKVRRMLDADHVERMRTGPQRDPLRVMNEGQLLDVMWSAGWKERARIEIGAMPLRLGPDPLLVLLMERRAEAILT